MHSSSPLPPPPPWNMHDVPSYLFSARWKQQCALICSVQVINDLLCLFGAKYIHDFPNLVSRARWRLYFAPPYTGYDIPVFLINERYALFRFFFLFKLVSRYFEPGQPQRIISGLKTNFSLSPTYLLHKSLYQKSSFFFFSNHNSNYIHNFGTQTHTHTKNKTTKKCFRACLHSAGSQQGKPASVVCHDEQGDLFCVDPQNSVS